MKVLHRFFARKHVDLSRVVARQIEELVVDPGTDAGAQCRHVALVPIEPGDYGPGFRCYVCREVFTEEAALALRRRDQPDDDPGGETAGDRAPRPRPHGGLLVLTVAKPLPPDEGVPPQFNEHIRAFPADWDAQGSI